MVSPTFNKQPLISLRLKDYEVNPETGFLPPQSPAKTELPKDLQPIQETATHLPKWLTLGHIRHRLQQLPEINLKQPPLDDMQLRRAISGLFLPDPSPLTPIPKASKP